MEVKLYVGNLSYSATEEDLKELFSQAGTVKSVAVIKDRGTGRPQCFAFVEMAATEEAEKAIAMFHSQDFMGRKIALVRARSGLHGDSTTDAPPPSKKKSQE